MNLQGRERAFRGRRERRRIIITEDEREISERRERDGKGIDAKKEDINERQRVGKRFDGLMKTRK